MEGVGYLRFAALILLVMPVVILPWEGRRPPAAIYAVIGAAGLAFSFLDAGLDGAGRAVATGLVCLVALSSIVATIRSCTGRQILTGGQIKLFSSAAMWLGIAGAMITLTIALLALFSIGVIYRINGVSRRPDSSAVFAASILLIGFGQLMYLA